MPKRVFRVWKRIHSDLHFYYFTSAHDRFYEGARPSFNEPSKKKKKRLPRGEQVQSLTSGQLTLPVRGTLTIRPKLHKHRNCVTLFMKQLQMAVLLCWHFFKMFKDDDNSYAHHTSLLTMNVQLRELQWLRVVSVDTFRKFFNLKFQPRFSFQVKALTWNWSGLAFQFSDWNCHLKLEILPSFSFQVTVAWNFFKFTFHLLG